MHIPSSLRTLLVVLALAACGGKSPSGSLEATQDGLGAEQGSDGSDRGGGRGGDAEGGDDAELHGSLRLEPEEPGFFGVAAPLEVLQRNVEIHNAGQGPLSLEAITFQGDRHFQLVVGLHVLDGVADSEHAIEPALEILPGEHALASLTFVRPEPGLSAGVLVLHSDDPERTEGLSVSLLAEALAPCATLEPTSVDVGPVEVGEASPTTLELTSCGEVRLTLSDVQLEGASGWGLAAPLESLVSHIAPGESLPIPLIYAPDVISPLGESGLALPDTAALNLTLDIESGGASAVLSGFGVAEACPQAVAFSLEGGLAIPDTPVHLIGSKSEPVVGSEGEILEWSWTVETPLGAQGDFAPSASWPDPVFPVDVPGLYRFVLDVIDDRGVSACEPAAAEVVVGDLPGLRVELSWEGGGDLDLHFLRLASALGEDLDGDGSPDGWFDELFDCHFANPSPDAWGTGPLFTGAPVLSLDVQAGEGPEYVTMEDPASGEAYGIGVHVWSDKGGLPQSAEIKVFAFGTLIWQAAYGGLKAGQLWQAAEVDWPSGEVSAPPPPALFEAAVVDLVKP